MLQVLHNSTFGDFVYAIPLLRKLAESYNRSIQFIIGNDVSYYHGAKRFLESQSCIAEVVKLKGSNIGNEFINIDPKYRSYVAWGKDHLVNAHLYPFGYNRYDFENDGSWLEGISEYKQDYAVVNVTDRYRDKVFSWKSEIRYLKDRVSKVLFLGNLDEYHAFPYRQECTFIRGIDMLDMAKIIAEAAYFSGNQSSALAIRQALGLPYRFEMSPNHADCNQWSTREKILNPHTRKMHIAYIQAQRVINEQRFNSKVIKKLSR